MKRTRGATLDYKNLGSTGTGGGEPSKKRAKKGAEPATNPPLTTRKPPTTRKPRKPYHCAQCGHFSCHTKAQHNKFLENTIGTALLNPQEIKGLMKEILSKAVQGEPLPPADLQDLIDDPPTIAKLHWKQSAERYDTYHNCPGRNFLALLKSRDSRNEIKELELSAAEVFDWAIQLSCGTAVSQPPVVPEEIALKAKTRQEKEAETLKDVVTLVDTPPTPATKKGRIQYDAGYCQQQFPLLNSSQKTLVGYDPDFVQLVVPRSVASEIFNYMCSIVVQRDRPEVLLRETLKKQDDEDEREVILSTSPVTPSSSFGASMILGYDSQNGLMILVFVLINLFVFFLL